MSETIPDLPALTPAGLAEFGRVAALAEPLGLWAPVTAGMAFSAAQAYGLLADATASLAEHGALTVREGKLVSTGWIEQITRISATARWYVEVLLSQQGQSLRDIATRTENAALVAQAEDIAASAAESEAQ